MIKLYIGSSCSSSRRAKRWLITHDIPFIEQNLIRQPLTKNEFIHLLKLTNNGVTEMLSTHSISYKNLVHRIDELSLSELYIEIRTSPSLLKKPIIYDQPAKLLTGFSEDKIRMFLPKTKRKQELNELLLSGHLVEFKENNLCVPVISCFSNMLVNKNKPGKATTSPGNTALSNEIFTQKSIVLFNFKSVAFILYFTRWKRERK